MLSLLHPAVARMLLIGTPPLAAALVLAALMLCGVNLLISNPASRIASFTHLVIESDVAGPCGFCVVINNWVVLLPQSLFLLVTYSSSTVLTYNLLSGA